MVFTKYTLVMCAYLFIKKSTRLLAEVRRVLFRGHNVILEESKTRMDEAKAERARGATLAGKSRLPFKGENSRRLRHRHDLHCWHRRANARFNAGASGRSAKAVRCRLWATHSLVSSGSLQTAAVPKTPPHQREINSITDKRRNG